MQSRYYDPATDRFLNADSYASTGQGILGNNMFIYCISNPVNCIDISGERSVAVRDYGGGYALGLSPAGFDPNGSFSAGKRKIDILNLSSFSWLAENEKVNAGIKTIAILTGGFDAYNIDNDGFNLLSFSLTGVSIDLKSSSFALSLFDLGNISASIGIGILPYATAMVSLWSPSVTIPVRNKQVSFTLHVGALGAGYKLSLSEFQFSVAQGVGFSVGIT